MAQSRFQILIEAQSRIGQAFNRAERKLQAIAAANRRAATMTGRLKRMSAQAGLALMTMARRAGMAARGGLRLLGNVFTSLLGGIRRLLNPLSLLVAGFIAFRTAVATLRPSMAMEDFETQFSVLLGSMDAAQERMAELAEFAAGTPFQIRNIVQASTVLQTLTRGALATGEGLRLVGDVAAGTGQDIGELATWFGRLYDGLQSGRPVGEAMMRLQELGAISGEARAQIERMQEAGVDGAEIWEFTARQFDKFGGLMEERSENLSGKISNLQDVFFNARAQFGAPIRDALTPLIGKINESLNKLIESNRLERAGQSIANFVRLFAQELAEGRLTQLLSLTIQAGFEQAAIAAKTIFTEFKLGEGIRQLIAGGAISGWERAQKFGLNTVATIGAALVAAFRLAIQNLIAGLTQAHAFIVNKIIGALNKIPKINIQVSAEGVRAVSLQEAYNDALGRTQKLREVGEQAISATFDKLRDFAEVQEGVTSSAGKQLTASQKLSNLLDDIAEKRKKAADQAEREAKAAQDVAAGGAARRPGRPTDSGDGDGDESSPIFGTEGAISPTEGLRQANAQLVRMASLGSAINNTVGGAFQGISRSLQGLIKGTQSWLGFLRSIPVAIGNSIIKAFADMVTAFIVRRTMMFAFQQAMATKELALNAAKNAGIISQETATAGATAAAWTPAALLKSIATFGLAALIGASIFAAVMAGTQGFATGGPVQGGRQVIQVNEEGPEFVVNHEATRENLGVLEFINAGGNINNLINQQAATMAPAAPSISAPALADGGLVGSVPEIADGGGSVSQASERQPMTLSLIMVDDERQANTVKKDADGEAYIVKVGKQHKTEIGIT